MQKKDINLKTNDMRNINTPRNYAVNFQRIVTFQKDNGFYEIQEMINSGLCWKLEGSVGRSAMALLETGICMLPKVQRKDAYGSLIPSRDNLKKGTKGTYQNAVNFWTKVVEGDVFIEDFIN